jgi:hypothetical protein
VATLVAVAFVVRLPVFCETFASGDEATYSALSAALRDGHRLYAGAVDHKPPFLAATYAAIQAAAGSNDIHIVHAVSILIVCATALLLSAFAGRFGLSTAEQRAAALVYVLAASTGPGKDMLATNGEILMALPAVAALVVAWPCCCGLALAGGRGTRSHCRPVQVSGAGDPGAAGRSRRKRGRDAPAFRTRRRRVGRCRCAAGRADRMVL